MRQLTKEEAIEFAKRGEWKKLTANEKVKIQLYQDRLCIDFSAYHEAVEKVLKRPVFTHEFAFPDLLRKEYEGKKGKPTWEEILNLLGDKKPIIVMTEV